MNNVDANRQTDAALREYYAARAQEYESIYHRPERQQDQRKLESHLPDLLSGPRDLKLASGTGDWTHYHARKTRSLVTQDANTQTHPLTT